MNYERTTTRDEIVAAARRYDGAPYLHLGRRPDGMDCVGLLICVARDTGMVVPDDALPHYNPGGWTRILCETLPQWLIRIDPAEIEPGDVVGLAHEPQKHRERHVGIITDRGVIQMSPYSTARIVEHSLTVEIRDLIVSAWRFPHIA